MVLHTSLSYLQKMQNLATIDFFDEGLKAQLHTQMQWFDLVTKGFRVIETNATDAEIQQCNDPLIRYLVRHGRLRPQQKKGQFQSPFHLYAEKLNLKESKREQKRSGCFHVNTTGGDASLFGHYLHHFDTTQWHTWQFAKPALAPHNSIVVADPYLYTDYGMRGLLAMFREVAPAGLQHKYHITLMGKPPSVQYQNGVMPPEIIGEQLEQLKFELEGKGLQICIENLFCDNVRFHDRYIITNNVIVFLGYGVGVLARDEGQPHREGTWIAVRPFARLNEHGKEGVFIAELINKKLETFRVWLSKAGINNIVNPLLLKL